MHRTKTTRLSSLWIMMSMLVIIAVAVFVRSWRLIENPPSLYWEEVALGYDAFSLAQTGKDHHGNPWPVVAAESFGDYKPAGYIYTIVPLAKLFGLQPWIVRAPSVMAGVSLGIAVGLLLWLVAPRPWRTPAAVVGLGMAALSPWGILFSRAGWEVNLATACMTWAIVVGIALYQLRWRKQLVVTAAMVLVVVLLWFALYTYHAARMIAPVIGLGLAVSWLVRCHKTKSWRLFLPGFVLAAALSAVAAWPLVQSWGSPVLTQRWAETSIFATSEAVEISNAHQDGSLLNKFFYHRYLLYGKLIAINFLSHLRPDFLFLNGDVNARHSTQFTGLLYYSDALFLVAGVWWMIRHPRKLWLAVAGWWALSIVPAALTVAVPHALRTLPSWPVYMLLISLGVLNAGEFAVAQLGEIKILARWLTQSKRWVVYGLAVLFITLAQWAWFWRFYMGIYPVLYAADWQYGYQQLVTAILPLAQQDPSRLVYVTREQGRPAMYVWFYGQVDPRLVQAENGSAQKDQGEFLSFQNWRFVRSTNEVVSPGIVASSPSEWQALSARYHTQLLKEIRSPRGEQIWMIYEVTR